MSAFLNAVKGAKAK